LEELPSGTGGMSTTLENSDFPRTVRPITDEDAIIAAVV